MGAPRPQYCGSTGAADLRALDHDLLGRIDAWMAWLGITGRRRGNRWIGGEKGARIEVVLTGSNAGSWGAWSAGRSGRGTTGIATWAKDISFGAAIKEARHFLGEPDPADNRRQPEPEPQTIAERRQRRIEKARKLWAEARPIAGTIAETYLTEVRGFPVPTGGWPDDIRFHGPERALILAGRTDAGEVQFVHRVFLTIRGANVRDHNGAKKKRTHGPMEGATFRLPGDLFGPVQHAEGGESAIAGWLATGYTTACRFGPIGDRAQPEPHCTNILLADDDPAGHPTEEALRRALPRWRAAGLDVVVAYPWPERRHDKSDVADVLREAGITAAGDYIRAAKPVSEQKLSDAPAPGCTDAQRLADHRQGTNEPPPPKPRRPNTTMVAHRAKMEAAIDAWAAGEGPRHVLNNYATGTKKNRYTIIKLAEQAKEQRDARRKFINNWRAQHIGAKATAAAEAANAAGYRVNRTLMGGTDHGILKQHRDLAFEKGMRTGADAGYERPYEPSDKASPPRCTQPKRREHTQRAGEAVRLVACGIDEDGPHCIDRPGCRMWQSIGEVAHAEFVTAPSERLTGHHVPRELRGFENVLIDEPPERVFRPERELKLDLLDDHLFERAPCFDADGNRDEGATTEAREVVYPIVRAAKDAMANGYWCRATADANGCTAEVLDRFVALSNMRDRSTGMTAATPDAERESLARISFCHQARSLCGFGRMAAAVQRGEEGEGKIELDGEAPRIARYYPRATLHETFLKARIMVTGAGLKLEEVRQWLPDCELMEGSDDIPEAPHQTLVHMHIGMGAGATDNPQRQRFMQAFVKLEAEGLTGVLALKDREEVFSELPGLLLGHHGAIVGRNDWLKCTTFFNFGSRFLSPPDAASAGAADTGEKVPVKRAARVMRAMPMRNGESVVLPTMEYEHPAAAAANAKVRDFDIRQGPLARPRACDRTPETHVTTFDLSTAVIDGCEWDVVITGWPDYAPERMVIAMAERGYMVKGSFCRHKLFPDLYVKPWTGQNDHRLETGGFEATMLRHIVPAWRDGPREPVVLGRFWRAGHAYRGEGEEFISTMRAFPAFKAEAEAKLGAIRIRVERTLWPDRPITEPELSIIQQLEEELGVIDSWGTEPPPGPFAEAPDLFATGPPPDG
jgi:hypothetical protein